MKKPILLLCLIGCTLLSLAQKGEWYTGGQLGFNVSQFKTEVNGNTSTDGKTSSWTFGPEIGTFLNDRVQIGTGIILAGTRFESETTPNNISRGLAIGGMIYSRYFWGKNTFRPFAGIHAGYTYGKSKNSNSIQILESKQTNFITNLNAGFSYALSKKVNALGSFGFLGFNSSVSQALPGNTKQKYTSFGLDVNSLGNRFTIGFYYTL